MYTIRQAVGKGLGVFATQDIARGQRILTDKALLSVSKTNLNVLQSVDALSEQARSTLLGLAINRGAYRNIFSWLEALWVSRAALGRTHTNHRILNIFRNNNFDIGRSVRSVFPIAARINHSCVPNAQGNFNRDLEAFTVHATHDIDAGREITVSYLDDHLALRDHRQRILKRRYGFYCDCEACLERYGAGFARASDARRNIVIHTLRTIVVQASSNPDGLSPTDELATIATILDFYEEEGIRGREAATLHIGAAKKAMELKQPDVARAFAAKGLMLEEEAVGRDSPFYRTSEEEVNELDLENPGLVTQDLSNLFPRSKTET